MRGGRAAGIRRRETIRSSVVAVVALLCIALLGSIAPGARAHTTTVRMNFGGAGENFEDPGWSADSTVTQDDFDDTSSSCSAWTSVDGIYSAVRDDQDLTDGTASQGAWSVCAAEEGHNTFGNVAELSAGVATVQRAFDLDDYLPYASSDRVTITSAELRLDHRMYSERYDNVGSLVELSVRLGDGTNNLPMTQAPVARYDPYFPDQRDPNHFVNDRAIIASSGGAEGRANFLNPRETATHRFE